MPPPVTARGFWGSADSSPVGSGAKPQTLFCFCVYLHCAKNWIYAIGYFAYISSLRIKNPTCGMNQFRTVFISSILNRITCA